ncbi:MAG: DUF2231 domain-containing protein [Opitutales bacterium]
MYSPEPAFMRILRFITPILIQISGLLSFSALQAQEPAFQFDGVEAALPVYRIFERSCAECHDGTSRSRSKGKFGTVLDFESMRADEDLIIPGNAEDSEIYLIVTDPDPEFLMPPPDSDCPPLTEVEAELVKLWINAGAPAPKLESASAPAPPEVEEIETPANTFNIALGRLHVLVIHFPIALILIAFLASLSELLKITPNARPVTSWCLFFGAFIAILSVASGWIHAEVSGYTDESVFNHRWSGVGVAISATLAYIAHLARSQEKRIMSVEIFFWVCLTISAIAVSIAGHTGGELVYGDETFFDLFR